MLEKMDLSFGGEMRRAQKQDYCVPATSRWAPCYKPHRETNHKYVATLIKMRQSNVKLIMGCGGWGLDNGCVGECKILSSQ